MSAQQITWVLTELFQNITDPKINQAIAETMTAANEFEKTYRGKITQLSPEGLLQCLIDVESFETKFSDLTLYSSLFFAADMTQPQAQCAKRQSRQTLSQHQQATGVLFTGAWRVYQKQASNNLREILIQLQAYVRAGSSPCGASTLRSGRTTHNREGPIRR